MKRVFLILTITLVSCDYALNNERGPAPIITPSIVFGTPSFEQANGIEAGDDGNLLILGRKDSKGYWLKLTPLGDTVWTRTTDSIVPVSAKVIGGGYVVNAYSSNSSEPTKTVVLGIGNAGNEVWRRDGLPEIVGQLEDGSLIAAGSIGTQRVLIKTDPVGNPIWQHFYRVSSGMTIVRPGAFWLLYSELKPGRFNYFYQSFCLKTDANGDSVGVTALDSSLYVGYTKADGEETYLTGFNYPDAPSANPYLVFTALDSLGATKFIRRFSGGNIGSRFIKQLKDGTFCIVGNWYGGIIFLKFDQAGEWVDTKVYDSRSFLNLSGITVLPSGEVAVTGTLSTSYGSDLDIFLLIFDADGLLLR